MLLVRDADLLRRFRKGEARALATVFDHYSETLAVYLVEGISINREGRRQRLMGLHNRHDLHDVIAETFRRAFERSARLAYSGRSPYAAYLRTIARNIIIDRVRSPSGRWIALEDAPPNATQESSGPGPERAYHLAELARLLQSFLEQLSPLERRFVELRYQQEMSQEKVAACMCASRRWVRTIEASLRRRLADHLRHTGYLPVGRADLRLLRT